MADFTIEGIFVGNGGRTPTVTAATLTLEFFDSVTQVGFDYGPIDLRAYFNTPGPQSILLDGENALPALQDIFVYDLQWGAGLHTDGLSITFSGDVLDGKFIAFLSGAPAPDFAAGGGDLFQEASLLVRDEAPVTRGDRAPGVTHALGDFFGADVDDDALMGNARANRLNGTAQADVMAGIGGNDRLSGGAGNDTILSGKGDDTAMGGAGDDVLSGWVGNDRLTGDAGADQFAFSRGTGADVVTDFGKSVDTLVLDNSLWAGRLTAQQVVARFATDTGDDVVLDFGARGEITLDGLRSLRGLAGDIDIV